jgi:N-acetylglucosamine-6-phosphate deacetylase
MTARLILGRHVLTGRPIRVEVEGGRIRSIEDASTAPDCWISPGLVDLQVNGYGGVDLNGDRIDAGLVSSLVEKVLATGTTTFLPTIITASEEKIVCALRAIAQARRTDPRIAHAIPFVHIEGPHISPEDGARGAHPREHVRAPSLAEFERWQQASQNLVGMVTLSPHWDNSLEYIAALASRGVLVALGHSCAHPDRIRRAADAGATISTHLGNGIPQMLPRHPNLLWAQLAEDRLTATFIADGHHLPADTLRAMLRAKSIERSILISDSVALAGMPPGIYESPIGGRVELHSDGRLNTVGTAYLAGSAFSLGGTVARLAGTLGCAQEDAFRMATANPGRLVGGRGVLQCGSAADLIVFSRDQEKQILKIETVFAQGIEVAPAP